MAVNDAPTLFGLFIGLVAVVRADILVIGGPRNDTIYRFPDMPASEQFGPAIPNEGLEGYLVLASPIQACTPVLPPPYSHNASVVRPWILLIRRGGCDFDAKVINAQNAGYIAAVVYNNGSQNLIPMSGNRGDEVHIPSVFVSYRDGLVLISDCLYMTGDYIVLTPDYPIISLNAILLPFAIVVGICFFVLTMVLVAKYVRDRRRRRRHRLPKSQLKKIPVKKFRKGDGNDVCAICLDEFEEGEKMRVLPCHHQYHCKCVDPWLLNNKRVCPVCKRRVIPGDDSDDEERAGQSSTEPSEHTPLLFSSQTASAPLENDIPVRHPPLLVNVEFLSDDEYDGDSEGSREASYQNRSDSFPSTSRNAEIAPSTSGINHTAASGQLPVLINTTVVADEEEDVALIHLNEYDDGSGKVLH